MSTYADIINKRKKDWNCEHLIDDGQIVPIAKIPFSSPLLNYSTYGGIPRNKVTEFFGVEGGGKSSTAIDMCRNAVEIFEKEFDEQIEELRKKVASGNKSAVVEIEELQEMGPKKVLYIDLEHTFDNAWAKTLGVDVSKIDVMQPPDITAEEILQTVLEIVESGELGFIVLDSVPSLVPKTQIEKNVGDRTVGALAGLMTEFLRKVVPKLARYKTTLLLINQLRDNMDNPYVPNTPGGRALKFYTGLRMQFRIGAPVDFMGNELPQSSENPAGYKIIARIVKQKTGKWDRRNGSYYLMADSGIRIDMDYCHLALEKYGIIKKGGAWFTLCDPFTGEILEADGKPVKLNGFAKVLEYTQSHPEYFDMLKRYIIADIEGVPVEEEEVADENQEGVQ